LSETKTVSEDLMKVTTAVCFLNIFLVKKDVCLDKKN